jgi:cytoskeletal protein CcmA (bactofilin family)
MRRAAVLLAVLAGLVAAAPAHADDDQIVITGDVEVARGETVGDVIVIDGFVRVDGRVTGDLIAVSAPVRLSGLVEGDVVAVADTVLVLPSGRIEGDLLYGDKEPIVERPAGVEGDTRRFDVDEFSDPFDFFIGRFALWIAFSASSLALGLLMLWLVPRALEAALWVTRTSTGTVVGMGVAVFLGVPAAAVLALITLVGIPLGIGLLLALLPLYGIGYATSAWLLGRAIVRPPRGRVLAFLAGWGILRLIALVPILGGLAWLGATVFGLGALTVALWRARRGRVTGPRGEPVAT